MTGVTCLGPETMRMQMDQEQVQAAWKRCGVVGLKTVAAEQQMATQQLVALFDVSGLTGRRRADPTPKQIEERSAAIRLRWTNSEAMERMACGR